MRKTALILLLLGLPVAAKPPEIRGYVRSNDLAQKLVDLREDLRRKEAFAQKPVQERMILLYQRGVPTFEKRRLTGELLVKEVLGWDDLDRKDPSKEALRIVRLLPAALKARLASPGKPLPKAERYAASKPLIRPLESPHFHIRQAAIDCLVAMYGVAGLYQPDLDKSARKKRAREWKTRIDRKRK